MSAGPNNLHGGEKIAELIWDKTHPGITGSSTNRFSKKLKTFMYTDANSAKGIRNVSSCVNT